MPFVALAFLFLWAVEVIFLYLCIQNFKSEAIVFLAYAGALFVWTLIAIWSSFWLLSRLWKSPTPSIAIFSDRFELQEDSVQKKVFFSDVEKITVAKQDFEKGYLAAIKPHHRQAVVADLFDRTGFFEECSKIRQLRFKVLQKLGGAVR